MMALAQGTLDRAALVAWVEWRCVER
jgi:hypothetical protein